MLVWWASTVTLHFLMQSPAQEHSPCNAEQHAQERPPLTKVQQTGRHASLPCAFQPAQHSKYSLSG